MKIYTILTDSTHLHKLRENGYIHGFDLKYLCHVDGIDSPDEDETSFPLPVLVLIVVLAAVAILLVVGLILWACAKDTWWKRRGERVPTDDDSGASVGIAMGGYRT